MTDRIVAILLLVGSGAVAAALSFAGLFLVMGTDSCGTGTTECNTDLFVVGWVLTMGTPLVGFLVTAIVTIVRMTRGLRAFWVPVAGTLAYGAAYMACVALAFAALGA